MSLIKYVNPLQGTDSIYPYSNGNTLPLISMPFAMNAWAPQTTEAGGGWWFSPHHNRLEGIRVTHQPSPWIGDYGHMTFMPQTGPLKVWAPERSSSFRKQDMIVRPDYFKVRLLRYQTTMELAPTERCSSIRLSYDRRDEARFILSPFPGESAMLIDPANSTLTGYTTAKAGGTPDNYRMYFVVKFNCPIDAANSGLSDNDNKPVASLMGMGERMGAHVGLVLPENGIVEVNISTSFISQEQAFTNLDREIGARSFDEVHQLATAAWEKQLGVIEVEDQSEDKLKTFYTCLYRTSLFPHAIHEYDAEGKQIHYSPYNGKIEAGPLFADIGFWDTYRTSFPLYNLLYPSFVNEMMQGWVNAYNEAGWMPKWASPGERSMMPGTLIDVSFADAIVKGNTDFDVEAAFEGLLKHATTVSEDNRYGRKGMGEYLKFNYMPADIHTHESVCNTLDYVYGDFCVAQIAKHLGREADYEQLMERAKNYKNLYDPSVGFMRGKLQDGSWLEPFDPTLWGGPYTEGGAYQSSWAVQHDFLGLAELMGGRAGGKERLDALFAADPAFKVGSYGFEIHEMSEMAMIDFGQFAISNQPSFHFPYIYTALGYPALTQQWVRKTMDELFSSRPDGLPGDEDNGSLCGWYVFGAMGLYPLSPGVPEYVIGTPYFDKMTVHLESGKQIVIQADNNSADNKYVAGVKLNGTDVEKLYFTHEQLTAGGTIQFSMSDKAQAEVAEIEKLPYSMSK
ncbi:GH92 family glycosyl hydrolase [Paenibacillus sp. ACRRX]|uniref:GH92 family glycosyl hydrolase n=1 Tax=unclassified Paenibacillus TaxID=185978 RepID=UPI001EF6D51A|nr:MULTISPECIES: GH92 family glycosyl hydrolase [unclassified Paenibacillus]MCG7409146.1 GH92 family glycosyl hydrolase [Paenibacillus sp. ACRRX]MDK8181860.1 GH92 family glycosyl hydrolase [Paenibacillus sp. UMB4589-SE434]